MNDHKILFSGPIGAGKTTAIESISDIELEITEEKTGDTAQNQKPGATITMDYGMISLDNRERIHLYGTPGQLRSDFMWETLTRNGIGLILLVSNTRPDPFGDMHFFLDAFKHFINRSKVVIGVTQMDLSRKPSLEDYYLQLEDGGLKIPIFEVDARKKRDISVLLEALLYSINPGLEG
jgi:uncharacterized protein